MGEEVNEDGLGPGVAVVLGDLHVGIGGSSIVAAALSGLDGVDDDVVLQVEEGGDSEGDRHNRRQNTCSNRTSQGRSFPRESGCCGWCERWRREQEEGRNKLSYSTTKRRIGEELEYKKYTILEGVDWINRNEEESPWLIIANEIARIFVFSNDN